MVQIPTLKGVNSPCSSGDNMSPTLPGYLPRREHRYEFHQPADVPPDGILRAATCVSF